MQLTPILPRATPAAICIGALVIGTPSTPKAAANTITETLNFSLDSNTTATTLAFTPFDAQIGALQSIEVTYGATRRHDWAIWNRRSGISTREVQFDASLTGSSVTLGGTEFAFGDLHYGPTMTYAIPFVSLTNALTEFQAGRTQFLAGQTPSYASAYHPGATYTTINGALTLPTFDGQLTFSFDPGDLNVAYFDGVWTLNAQNVFAGSLVDVIGSATVTYHFDPIRVPDEMGTAFAICAACAVMAWRRKLLCSLAA